VCLSLPNLFAHCFLQTRDGTWTKGGGGGAEGEQRRGAVRGTHTTLQLFPFRMLDIPFGQWLSHFLPRKLHEKRKKQERAVIK